MAEADWKGQNGTGLFHVPLGVDYPAAVLAGLRQRVAAAPPDALARVTVLVNTQRMKQRLTDLLTAGPPGFLPRLRLFSDLANDPRLSDLPPTHPPLRRQLELEQLVAALLDRTPDLAPRSASFDLADSLVRLVDEMQSEGVALNALETLDTGGMSGHWERSLQFLRLVQPLLAPDRDALDPEARFRQTVLLLRAAWQADPPRDPVLIVGSTGSRGPTRLLMQAVAALPRGAIILPGYDPHLPDTVWDRLDQIDTAEDHPQFRFCKIMQDLQVAPGDITPWASRATGLSNRSRLISLSLRPAPVTDQWLQEGPALGDPGTATAGLSLIEAPDSRSEAAAVALCMRKAVEDGRRVALISADRTLTRKVTAHLDYWRILPDDSAGRPLGLTAPGRLLRQVSELLSHPPGPDTIIALLKHPICHSGADRGAHLLRTRDLELALRDGRAGDARLRDHLHTTRSQADGGNPDGWVDWLIAAMDRAATHPPRTTVVDHVRAHLDLARHLARGSSAPDGDGSLWLEEAGQDALTMMDELAGAADAGGVMPIAAYRRMIVGLMSLRNVRLSAKADPRVMIWGTLEARVQGVDLVILGGLNDGVWPRLPDPDPWLNRQMRTELTLPSPERQIGLSAHDYEQAITQPNVILSRAMRDAESQTVPSRWLNRLINLLDGLGPDGKAALAAMRDRGRAPLDLATRLSQPTGRAPAATRPAPRPPVAVRPTRLSVTRVQTLIRDPYTIYAQRVLGLWELRPLRDLPDAGLRGTVLHKVLERFVAETMDGLPETAPDLLVALTDDTLAAQVPWPATRRLWRGRLLRVGAAFLADERDRRAGATPMALEQPGAVTLPSGFVLTAEADRIDRALDGTLHIYDYKTGKLPSEKEIRLADKQLPLEGAIAQRGGFGPDVPAERVSRLSHIGIGSRYDVRCIALDDDPIGAAWDGLETLIAAYARPGQGYTALRLAETRHVEGAYAHLARFGEWDLTDPAHPEDVG